MTKRTNHPSKRSELDSRINRRLRAAASFISAFINLSIDGKICLEQLLGNLLGWYHSNNLVASEPQPAVVINHDYPTCTSVRSAKKAWLKWRLMVQEANLTESQRVEAIQEMVRVLLSLREKDWLPPSLIRFEALRTLEWMWLDEDIRGNAALAEAQRSPEYQKLLAEKDSAPDPVEVSRKMVKLFYQAWISAV